LVSDTVGLAEGQGQIKDCLNADDIFDSGATLGDIVLAVLYYG